MKKTEKTIEEKRVFDVITNMKFDNILLAIEKLERLINEKFKDYDNVCDTVTRHDEKINLLFGFVFGGFGLFAVVLMILKMMKVL